MRTEAASISSGERWRPADYPARQRSVSARPGVQAQTPFILRMVFYVFLFSVVFEGYDPLGVSDVFTIAKLSGYVLFFIALAHKSQCFNEFPKPFILFVIPGLFMVVHSILNPALIVPAVILTLTYVQMTVLFLISCNLLRRPGMLRNSLIVLAFSVALLAALSLLGITGTQRAVSVATAPGHNTEIDRDSAFGMDENYIGMLYGLGAISCLGFAAQKVRIPGVLKVLLWPAFIVIIWPLVQTGSRGAMASFGVGMLALLFVSSAGKHKIFRLLRAGFVVAVVAALFWKMVLSSQIATDRWNMTIEHGDTASRSAIWLQVIAQLRDTWLFGEGIPMAYVDLGRRLTGFARMKGPHNEFLNMFLIAGITGAVCALGGWYYCVRSAWRVRATPLGAISFAAVVFVLTMSCDVAVYHRKIFWLTLALAYAAGRMVNAAPIPHRRRALPSTFRNARQYRIPEQLSIG